MTAELLSARGLTCKFVSIRQQKASPLLTSRAQVCPPTYMHRVTRNFHQVCGLQRMLLCRLCTDEHQ